MKQRFMLCLAVVTMAMAIMAQEKSRGLWACKSIDEKKVFVSWRMRSTDDPMNRTYKLYANDRLVKTLKDRTTCKLAKHEDQQVVPMRHGPAFGPFFVLGDNAPELPLREEAGDLCENVCSNVHICSDFESDAKVRISRFGQESVFRKCCA